MPSPNCEWCGGYKEHYRKDEQYCLDCAGLASPEEVTHHAFIRCPGCGEVWSPRDSEDYKVYADGEHTVCCSDCDCEFEVSTSLSFTFTSPERDKPKEEA